MPKLDNQAASASPAQTVTPTDAEPDVPWGVGGIDDWGWTSREPTTKSHDSEADRR